MSVRWDLYRKRFSLDVTEQLPMPEALCYQIERWVGEVFLHLSPEDLSQVWADPSLPGRDAITVFRFLLSIDRIGNAQIRELAQKWRVSQVGIKVYRTGAPSFVEFHNNRADKGESLQSSPFIQKSLRGDQITDWDGKLRGLVVQQWVEGYPLDQFICLYDFDSPLPGAVSRRLLVSLLCDLGVEVWYASSPGKGRVWDWRPANLVVSDDQSYLSLIDADCLRPINSTGKNNEELAFSYLQKTTSILLKAQGLPDNINSIKEAVRSQMVATGLLVAISNLGESVTPREADRQRDVVERHVHYFLAALQNDGLLL